MSMGILRADHALEDASGQKALNSRIEGGGAPPPHLLFGEVG
jgi:hypothetical protein